MCARLVFPQVLPQARSCITARVMRIVFLPVCAIRQPQMRTDHLIFCAVIPAIPLLIHPVVQATAVGISSYSNSVLDIRIGTCQCLNRRSRPRSLRQVLDQQADGAYGNRSVSRQTVDPDGETPRESYGAQKMSETRRSLTAQLVTSERRKKPRRPRDSGNFHTDRICPNSNRAPVSGINNPH